VSTIIVKKVAFNLKNKDRLFYNMPTIKETKTTKTSAKTAFVIMLRGKYGTEVAVS